MSQHRSNPTSKPPLCPSITVKSWTLSDNSGLSANGLLSVEGSISIEMEEGRRENTREPCKKKKLSINHSVWSYPPVGQNMFQVEKVSSCLRSSQALACVIRWVFSLPHFNCHASAHLHISMLGSLNDFQTNPEPLNQGKKTDFECLWRTEAGKQLCVRLPFFVRLWSSWVLA